MTAVDASVSADLRLIGIGYEGKEPFEYTADVLRTVTRLTGAELGFEACLTSRPFTATTFVARRPGVLLPGRTDAAGAARASLDLADGLSALTRSGFTVTALPPGGPAPPSTPDSVVLAGPLRVPGRWTPAPDRLVVGDAWRHVVVDAPVDAAVDAAGAGGGDAGAVCLDPVFGGYTTVPATDLVGNGSRRWLVRSPDTPVDRRELARRCWYAGAGWRCGETGADRDEQGLAALADRSPALVAGAAPNRLSLSLANHALQATRWGGLLGHCGPLTTDELALADLLRETVTWCRVAERRTRERDPRSLRTALSRLGVLARAVGELCRRHRGTGER